MGTFNSIMILWIDHGSNASVEIEVQFRYGDVWQYRYGIGDQIRWGVMMSGIHRRLLPSCPDGHLH